MDGTGARGPAGSTFLRKPSSLGDSEADTAGQVAGLQFIDQIEFERSNGLTTGATLAPG